MLGHAIISLNKTMAEQEDGGLLAIEVNADDYVEAAAGDAPSVSRTYQSEEDFQVHKKNYTAKVDGCNTHRDLIAAVPVLATDNGKTTNYIEGANGESSKVKLSKKDFQLLGYAVGELYYDKRYDEILSLCDRVRDFCDVDDKTKESLDRWTERCRARLAK